MLKKILKFVSATILILVAAFAVFAWWSLQPKVDPQPLPDGLVSLSATEGQALLADADATADFEALSARYESQILRSYCGVASSVSVLSALGKDVSQKNFFNNDASEVRSRWSVTFGGMSLPDLAGLLESHGAAVEYHHADSISEQQFRQAVQENLQQADDYIVVNYQREVLGQRRVGHISPVAAYDIETDSVLIMDTASYNYPPTWVPVSMLYKAMLATDPSTGNARGYVEVSGSIP